MIWRKNNKEGVLSAARPPNIAYKSTMTIRRAKFVASYVEPVIGDWAYFMTIQDY